MKQQVVVVTGGSYGIGFGIASYFARRNFIVIVAARNPDRGEAARARIENEGGRAVFITVDVQNEDSITALFRRSIEQFGRVDVLCNNAGIERYARADQYSSTDFDEIHGTNLRGMFLCAKYAFPHLKTQTGSIVNISSVQGIANEANISAYAASKAGILGLTRGLAIDFAPFGVRVNAVCPGAIGDTGMMENAVNSLENPEAAIEAVCKGIPLGRMGTPADIAAAVFFLASAEAGYISGASLVVDGALLARLAI